MMNKNMRKYAGWALIAFVLFLLVLWLSGCGPTPQPEIITKGYPEPSNRDILEGVARDAEWVTLPGIYEHDIDAYALMDGNGYWTCTLIVHDEYPALDCFGD